VTLCSDVVGYRRFGRPCCLYLQSEAHDMACPQVVDGRDGLQIWRVAVNILVLIPCEVGPLSPLHGASSGCGWRRRPSDVESRCQYTE
jgi:hypothetical protein